MATQTLDDRLQTLNQRLKLAQLGVQIERRGQKLSLRGTLPPRPNSARLKPYQQRIRLNLPATPDGLKQAEKQAKIVAAQLIQGTFSWADYLVMPGGKLFKQLDLPQQMEAFQQQFFQQAQRNGNGSSAKTTWRTAYAPYVNKLLAIAQDHGQFSLPELIYATVLSTPENSRSRQVCCTAMSAIAEFLHLDLPDDLKLFWGNYSPSQTQTRQLPSDADILAIVEKIPNPAWRFVYGVMATYGLRNHEVFFCNYQTLQQGQDAATVEVLETSKTGYHEVWPFMPDWVDWFNLREVNLPKLNTDLGTTTLQRVGQLVSNQFRRYEIPFSPYDLRHAWAIRTIHVGIPDTVAARMMGHSVAIHTRTYHRWITRRDHQQVVDAALRRHGSLDED